MVSSTTISGKPPRFTEVGPGTSDDIAWGTFVLDGQRFIGINGGRQFPFSEAVSSEIRCKDQAEVDYCWERLVDGGVGAPPACGGESQCGWLRDKFGLSWQVTPDRVYELPEDPVCADMATRAMHAIRKIVIAELEDAVTVN